MQKYTTRDFDQDFPTDDVCLEFLFRQRWPDGVHCPKCNRITPHYRIADRPCYSCQHCGSHVYPMAGTIFGGTRFSHLRLWFKAVAYMAVTRCGISSRQLSRDLGVGVKTGWRMFHQIRKVLAEDEAYLKATLRLTKPTSAASSRICTERSGSRLLVGGLPERRQCSAWWSAKAVSGPR